MSAAPRPSFLWVLKPESNAFMDRPIGAAYRAGKDRPLWQKPGLCYTLVRDEGCEVRWTRREFLSSDGG